MSAFHTDINIQTLIALFVLVIALVATLFGFLLWRFEFLDGRSFYFSRGLGRILVAAGIVLTFAVLIMLFYVRVTL